MGVALKIAILLVVILGALWLFRGGRGAKPARRSGPKLSRRGVDLEACPKCGALRPADALCDCEKSPTP